MRPLSKSNQDEIISILSQAQIFINQYLNLYLYEEKVDNHLKQLVNELGKLPDTLSDKVQILKQKITCNIIDNVKKFNKNTILILTMALKQHANSIVLESGHSWVVENIIEQCLLLQKIIINIPEKEFKNGIYSHMQDDIIEALIYSREYLYISSNEELYINGHIFSCLKEFIDDFHENVDDTNFYGEHLKMGNSMKPELFEIQNENLNEWIKKKKIRVEDCYNLIGNDLKKQVGFNINELNEFNNFIEQLYLIQEDIPLISTTIEHLGEISGIKDKYLVNIIDFFSINKLINKNIVSERHLELRSIYKINDVYYFGMHDLLQSIFMFKNIILSGHFISDYYFIDVDRISNLNKCSSKMSTLMAYKVADYLERNGYVIPYQNYKDSKVALAEVRDLYDKNGKNIFVNGIEDFGDIDILAANIKKKEIYNIEFKYFAPAINYSEALKKDKRKIKNSFVYQILGREKVIKNNLNLILDFLEIKRETNDEFTIKSILVTARPNYFLTSTMNEEVKFLTWVKLMQCIQSKTL